MWRTLVSVFLAAIFGSIVATTVSMAWLSVTQGGTATGDDLRTGMAMAFAASWFTIPGAFFLAAVESGLAGRIQSARVLDGAIVLFGAVAGAAILGGLGALTPQETGLDFAPLGGLFGLTTAVLFVFFQRQLGSRRERHF